MLRLSVVCTECIVAKRCTLEQKLLLTAYIGSRIWEIDWYQKRMFVCLCLEVVSRSCQPLSYIQRWISRKRLEIEPWFQRTTNRKWPTGIKWSCDRLRHMTIKSQTRNPNMLRAQYLENSWGCYSATNDNFTIYLICCEAVRSAILATAWLLVFLPAVLSWSVTLLLYIVSLFVCRLKK